jgi:DNA-binding winged helix-turn-helix (wHTH) protein/Tol biopolymer transport system component
MPDYAAGFQLVPPARHFRFGPFQVDSRSGELRKHGIKLKLGQQTFQLLLMLLEHPAEVLLREEIRQKLWPHDTVVEFDHSINAAIQKLRAALGESAGSPLYIETLARRGYRFIGTIEIVPAPPSVASVPTSVPKPVEPVPGPAEKISGRRLRSVAVLAGLAVLTVLTALGIMRPWAKREPVRNWSLSLGAIQDAVVSPDGSAVVYRGAQGLVLRRMNSLEETTVYPLNLSDRPVWSADGSQVLSRSSSAIFRLPLPNGPPVMIAPIARPTRGFAWSPDGAIVMAMFAGKLDTGGLFLVSAAGGDPKRLDLPPLTDGMFFYPEFLPDGKNLLFAWAAAGKGEVAIYLATLEGGSIVRGPILLRRNVASGQYSSSDGGRLLYVQNDNLYGQKLNVSQGVLEGSPEKIISGVYSEAGFHSPNFSVSRNGVLVWRGGHASFAQLTWLDRTGRVLGTAGPPCIPDILRLSPDERRVVIHTMTGYGIAEANRGGFVPLSGLTSGPIWMPDNSHILYGRNDANGVRLLARASAGGPEKELNRGRRRHSA